MISYLADNLMKEKGIMSFRPVHTLARGPHLHVDDLVVDETSRILEVGKILLDFSLTESKDRGMNFIFIAESKPSNFMRETASFCIQYRQ